MSAEPRVKRTPQTMILATRSAGKLRELLPLVAVRGWALHTLNDAGLVESADEDALEVFDTFEANALAKAEYFHARRPDCVVLADDSGLEVHALHGAPGVRSKRWSGRSDLTGDALDAANNAHLQALLTQVGATSPSTRRARYVCAAAVIGPGMRAVCRGTTDGVVLSSPRGDGGFGYDPFFLSDDLGMTFAEASREAKSRVSHRGRAFARLLSMVAEDGQLGVAGG